MRLHKVTMDPKPDYIVFDYVEQSMHNVEKTNFAVYLITLFGFEKACEALRKYFVGRSKNDNGKACIYWFIDKEQKVRTGKVMAYDPDTGKRRKEINPTWFHALLKNEVNYNLCFFGEHQLTEYPEYAVGIVESEKAAIIASIFMPDMIWLATGGSGGCNWKENSVYKVLENRTVMLFPDFKLFDKKSGKTCFEEFTERAKFIQERMNCTIKVSRTLEDNIPGEERANGFDLADMMIKECFLENLGLIEFGYPVFRGLYSAVIKN